MTKRKTGNVQNSQTSNKIKLSPSPPALDQLPADILEKIIGNLSFWHRKNIRFTNTRLHDVCDSQLWHEVQVALFEYSKDPLANKKYATLKVLQQVTRTYSDHGFRELFLGSLLSLLRQNYRDPFNITVGQVRKFLQKFYDAVDQSIGDPFCQRSKIMYLTTMVALLSEANNCCRVDLQLDDEQLHLSYEMTNTYMGMLWNIDYCQMRCPQFNYSSDKNDLLVVLSEILTMIECDTISR
jgi:F-box domain